MRTSRESVFETNSSSTHCVAICRPLEQRDYKYSIEELKDCIESDGFLHIDLGEFGWGIDRFIDPETKLSYLLTMLMEVNHLHSFYDSEVNFEDIERLSEWDDINNLIKETLKCEGIKIDNCSGYIDHQSCEDYRSVQDFLSEWGCTMEQFIFDDNTSLIIDNDNH